MWLTWRGAKAPAIGSFTTASAFPKRVTALIKVVYAYVPFMLDSRFKSCYARTYDDREFEVPPAH